MFVLKGLTKFRLVYCITCGVCTHHAKERVESAGKTGEGNSSSA